MKSRQDSRRQVPEKWKVQIVHMKVQNIEFVRLAPHPVQHEHVVRNDIPDLGVQPQSGWNAAHEVRRRDGVTAGE